MSIRCLIVDSCFVTLTNQMIYLLYSYLSIFFVFFFFILSLFFFFFFFFQAEDGIRDWSVTGVQTCALPICGIASTRGCWRRCACAADTQMPPRTRTASSSLE